MRRSLVAMLGSFALFSAGTTAHAANLLLNAGFEGGSLTPWAQTQDYSGLGYGDWALTSADAHSGTYAATDMGNKLIEQKFGGVLASSITEISFWLRHPGMGAAPMAVYLAYSDFSTSEQTINTNGTDWQFFNVTNFLDPTKVLVGFGIYGCSCGSDFQSTTLLDDAVIDAPGGPAGGVPEPAIWTMMISGLGLVGAALRRRRGLLQVA